MLNLPILPNKPKGTFYTAEDIGDKQFLISSASIPDNCLYAEAPESFEHILAHEEISNHPNSMYSTRLRQTFKFEPVILPNDSRDHLRSEGNLFENLFQITCGPDFTLVLRVDNIPSEGSKIYITRKKQEIGTTKQLLQLFKIKSEGNGYISILSLTAKIKEKKDMYLNLYEEHNELFLSNEYYNSGIDPKKFFVRTSDLYLKIDSSDWYKIIAGNDDSKVLSMTYNGSNKDKVSLFGDANMSCQKFQFRWYSSSQVNCGIFSMHQDRVVSYYNNKVVGHNKFTDEDSFNQLFYIRDEGRGYVSFISGFNNENFNFFLHRAYGGDVKLYNCSDKSVDRETRLFKLKKLIGQELYETPLLNNQAYVIKVKGNDTLWMTSIGEHVFFSPETQKEHQYFYFSKLPSESNEPYYAIYVKQGNKRRYLCFDNEANKDKIQLSLSDEIKGKSNAFRIIFDIPVMHNFYNIQTYQPAQKESIIYGLPFSYKLGVGSSVSLPTAGAELYKNGAEKQSAYAEGRYSFQLVKAERSHKEDDFDSKSLFIYFNGTAEDVDHQLNGFALDVKAGTHIYLNGVGTAIPDTLKYHNKNLEFIRTHRLKMENDEVVQVTEFHTVKKYTEKRLPKKIYAINRKYGNSEAARIEEQINKWSIAGYIKEKITKLLEQKIFGYTNDDSLHAALDVMKILKVHQLTKFDKIIISGHSRGAAIGLPSFLFGIKKAFSGDSKFAEYKDTLQKLFSTAQAIDIIPMDPVDGDKLIETNNYHMGCNWKMKEIYEFFSNAQTSNNWGKSTFHEFYANAATMILGGLDIFYQYSPAKRFIEKNDHVNRYWIGFHHGAMVSYDDAYSSFYEREMSPYKYMCKYINNLINKGAASIDVGKWRNRIKQADEEAAEKIRTKPVFGTFYNLIYDHYKSRHGFSANNISTESLIGDKGPAMLAPVVEELDL